MGDRRPALDERPPGGSSLSLLERLAKGRTSLFRSAYRINDLLNHSRCFEWKPLKSAKAIVRVLVNRIVGHDQEWVLADIHSRPMWIPRRTMSQYVLRDYEPLTSALFRECAKEGGTVLDIGAHVGVFSLLAAQAVGPGGHVYAFEPAPGNLEVLRRNMAINGLANVSCLGFAVAEQAGHATFVIAEANDSNSFYSHPLSAQRERLQVDCVTVDSFLAGRRADVVKIDAEGAEISILRGMQRTLELNRNIRLIVELNPACLRAAGHSGAELVAMLKSAGFGVRLIDERDHQTRELDERLLGVPRDNPSYYANLICTRA